MRRKFIAAVTSGVLALTVMTALPTHAESVSIWLDLTPGTESVETFQYKDYADRYSDAYELYGYDAEALFNHYETVGKAEGRVGRFKKTPEEDDRHPYVWDADEPLDPLPPLDFHAQPDWFDARTLPENLSNVRIIKEYEQLEAFIEKDEWIGDPVLVRKEELLNEMSSRARNYRGRRGGADYLRAISQDIDCETPSMGRAHLESVHAKLGLVRLTQSAFRLCEDVMNRWENVHNIKNCPMKAMDLLGSIVGLCGKSYIGMMNIQEIVRKAAPPDLEYEVLFTQELLAAVRKFPDALFDDDQSRATITDAVQAAVDDVVQREDEWLASLE